METVSRDTAASGGVVPSYRRIVDDLARRITHGEFRYCTPDGLVHERPFPTDRELAARHGVDRADVTRAWRELCRLGHVVLEFEGTRHVPRLTFDAPAVNVAGHPDPDAPLRSPPRHGGRRRSIAQDLVGRIADGEFADRDFPGQRELARDYAASLEVVRAVLDTLVERGHLRYEPLPRGRRAVAVPRHPHTPGGAGV